MQCPTCNEFDIGEAPWESWYRCPSCDLHPDTSLHMKGQRDEIANLKEQSASLRAFWNRLCSYMWDHWELDGGTFQDWGEELGLLKRVKFDPEVHGFIEADPGDDIFINALVKEEDDTNHIHDKCCETCATTGLLCPIRNNDEFTFPCPHWQPIAKD